MRPRGLSPLPVRPLRLSPMTATAGGRQARPRALPSPAGRRHARRARTRAGSAPSSQRSGVKLRGLAVEACSTRAFPIPRASHCLSRPEPVKGACGGPSGNP